MEPDRRSRISDLYHAALQRSSEERSSFLEEACKGDDALRREIESLLGYESDSAGFLETPAVLAASGLAERPDKSQMIGRQLGPYTILAPLGAGGMGEVYRARDSKLGREVAIKILPSHFTADPERRARFAREARLLATLNHPHIGAIYGLEETDGVTALVLELVEGPTLAQRLERGPLPIADALAIARQIAEALDTAHEKGIVHRDLKPANVVLQSAVNAAGVPSGDVRAKVLDFGLAKTLVAGAHDQAPLTVDGSHAATTDGRILGTPAYMSPEQARGEAVDKRTDIWAFGCVLYEMLAGRRAFEGETITDTLARVLERDPDWTALPAAAPGSIRTLLERCLRKDPRRRLHDVADALIELEDRAHPEGTGASTAATPVRGRTHRERLVWILAGGSAATCAVVTLVYLQSPRSAPPELEAFPIAPAEGSRFTGTSPEFAMSPDGRHVAFVASSTRETALWVRSLDALEPRAIAGTEGARNPFWSPDSQSIGYFADNMLKTVRITGGSPVEVCSGLQTSAVAPSGTWNSDGVIVFGPLGGDLHKVQVDSKSGTSTPASASKSDDTVHRWPSFLPDGQHFLYLALKGEKGELRVGSLDSPDSVALAPAESHAAFAAGHLFFVRGGNLMAQPFDADARRPTADPVHLGAQAGVDPPWQRGMFSVSQTGRLVYRPTARTTAQLTWLDRDGRSVGIVGDPGVFFNLDLSPDEQRVAISKLTQRPGVESEFDIWLIDVATGRTSKLTDDPAWEFDPAWSPDGTQVAFNSNRPRPGDPYGLFMRASSGSGKDVQLVEPGPGVVQSPDWSRTNVIVYTKGGDLWTMPMTGDRRPTAFLRTPQAEAGGVFSPDGRWIAYHSDAAGRNEVYVRPFPAREGVFPISRAGGSYPRWSGDGKELFFLSSDRTMMTARVDTARGFTAGVAQPLFPSQLATRNYRPYAVTRDGQRFLIPIETREPLRLVLDWRAMLER